MNARLEWRIAVRQSHLDPTAKHVALTLDTYMNRKGVAWPSRSTLAADTGRSVKTVDRALGRLEQAGLLIISRTRGRQSNRYRATTTTVAEVLTATLATFNRGRGVPRSRNEEENLDFSQDREPFVVDQGALELAHGWLAQHTLAL